MSINEFDRLLNEKFDQHEFAYNQAAWEQLSRQLPQNKGHNTAPFIWIKITGIAAALAITVGSVAWYYNHEDEKPLAVNTDNKHTQHIQLQVPRTPEKIESAPKGRTTFPTSKSGSVHLISHSSNRPQVTATVHNTAPQPLNNQIQTSSNEPIKAAIQPEQKEERYEKPEIVRTTIPDENDSYLFEPVKKNQSRTLFSLTGGMNYGSMNTGYMAGVNAKQKLGSKLFIEGDLAFVNNKASQSFTQQQQQMAAVSKSPIDYKDALLMYVQFNPTLGYQVMKNVSLGVGADIQKLVNDDNTLVNVNDEVKTIPNTDVGLTGKTEVSLSPRLKAGILYREGINNLLKSSDDLLERRYLQVQLKFTVIGK